jgi:DNA-binding NarL/FixJ family response regulator
VGEAWIWIDHPEPIYRAGLETCLSQRGFAVAGHSDELVPAPRLERVDILLFDLTSLDGVLALDRPSALRLVAIAAAGADTLGGLARGTLAGMVTRSDLTADDLARTLASVAGGTGCMPLELLAQLTRELRDRRSRPPADLHDRQVAVLRLLAEGATTEDIASELAYSERTVKNIVHDTLSTLGCRTRAHAVALASRHGVI